MKSISLLNISFAYSGSDDLFTDLSYSFSADKKVAIIGDNGVGKSTLLKIISGDLLPDSGRPVRNATCRRLEQINVDTTSSGGQSQQKALARAFDSGADILLLDEPTNNLDIKSTTVLENALDQYRGAILIVSHDEAFINELHTDRLVVIHG